VGAASLADALSSSLGDADAAFRLYEREHRRFIEPKQRDAGLAAHFLIPATATGIVARNLLVRTIGVFRGAPERTRSAKPCRTASL
jgi:hypothetical protein